MPKVLKSAIVAGSCNRMFALVDGVERYPEFLPWCRAAHVVHRDDRCTEARLDIDFKGLQARLATRNRKEPPLRMTLELIEGPFERFEGEWRFSPLGEEGCRVELSLDYRFRNAALEALSGAAFAQIARTLVDRFVARATALDGKAA